MEKQYEIINLLLKQQPLTAQQIADHLGVSPRTIKTYVKRINEDSDNDAVIVSSRKGYSINQTKAVKMFNDHKMNEDSSNRINELSKILLTEDKVFDIYDISEQLHYSESTIRKDLSNLKKYFQKFHITLNIRGDKIVISGSEINKRKIISDLLYKESNINFVNLEYLQENFNEVDIVDLNKTISNEIKISHLFINDYSLTNLTLHLAITIDRLLNGNISSNHSSKANSTLEYKTAKNLSAKLEKQYKVKFSKDEIFELSLLLSSRVSHLNDNTSKENIVDYIGENCLDLVDKIFNEINSNYGIEINDSDLKIRFGLHINNLITRSQNNYFSKNPLAQDFRSSCPLIYEVAVYASSIIKKELDITVNSDEIAYIAFHIGNAIEASRAIKNKINAVLLSPNYYDLNEQLVDKISCSFTDDLIIKDIITDEEELNYIDGLDLIISTVPIHLADIKTLQILPFFNKAIQKQLQIEINYLKQTKEKRIFRNHVKQFIIEDLFENTNISLDKNRCLERMTEKLISMKYVDNNYLEQVNKREKLSTTAFNNFAIPHTMKMTAKTTCLNILINKRGIEWGDNKVQLVIMICFSQNDRSIFNDFFEQLTNILSEPANVKLLTQQQSYSEFVDCLVNCFK